jgi:nucleotide-binding universal stress UspA family protein
MKIKKIAVTTDFSELAAKAYPAAYEIANRFDAQLHLIHSAVSLPPFYYVHAEGIPTDIPHDSHLEELGHQLEAEAKHSAFQDHAVEPHLIYHGFPQRALSTFARQNDIDLIIVSTHGRTGVGHFLLGSYAEKLVRLSTTPVLVYREGKSATSFTTALVPFDFSENSEAVFPLVRFLAEAYGTRFTFVYVLEPIPYTISSPSSFALSSIRDAAFAAPDVARKRFAKLKKEQLTGVDAEIVVCEGAPVTEILNLAKEKAPDVILSATHGWTGFKHLALGSVAEKVVRHAPCSVLTVRPAEAAVGDVVSDDEETSRPRSEPVTT